MNNLLKDNKKRKNYDNGKQLLPKITREIHNNESTVVRLG